MNVAYETGKTPRQLLEERDRLLEALIAALPYVEMAELDEAYVKGSVKKIVRQMNQAIKQATE